MKGKPVWRFRYLIIVIAGLILLGCAVQEDGQGPGRQESFREQDAGQVSEAGTGAVTESGTGEAVRTVPVVLYFGDNQGYLVAERREIPVTKAIARATLRELCRGPASGSGFNPTIPPGTRVKDINIRDGLAIVDFSRELKERHRGGSSAELLTVYSIVNTLTQFPSVQQVQILVEGRPLETLAGHLDISGPLKRDASLIRAHNKTN
ncbi:GerMN domain-containing protein [Desulfofundulus thermocisternus]|uniref:GerMN domain-containing protein n=1 Tax=Desulfofundulus thermocisternus TaxID=42471 RepID=UPI001A00904C|nr:GerMN domain-containing protein [Desulfofundulus thermocisternus]MBE3586261.1 GerMN domain-containing protein [Thermoanaerobacter sp.]MCS5695284.1 GerMN domain-containing protein [Desulfofundulus thermocisternus]